MLRAQPAHPALHRDQHRREHAAQVVERAHVERGDARQRDEIGALPEAVHVGLAQADAAAQERPVEAWRAHLQGDPQRAQGRGVAEGEALGALDDRQLTAVNATQQSQDEATGQPVAPAGLRAASRAAGACASGTRVLLSGPIALLMSAALPFWGGESSGRRATSAAERGCRSARGSARSGTGSAGALSRSALGVSSRRFNDRVASNTLFPSGPLESMCTSNCSAGSVKRQS